MPHIEGKLYRDMINNIHQIESEIKEQRELEISTCFHALVKIRCNTDENSEEDVPIYYCPKCGLVIGNVKHYYFDTYNNLIDMSSLADEYGDNGICVSPDIFTQKEVDECMQYIQGNYKDLTDENILYLLREYLESKKMRRNLMLNYKISKNN